MSATDQMRAMLDQLMGTARDGEEARRQKNHFTEHRVCKSFLLDCCPHDILQSTRMDLGECPKLHDLALRADYEAASKTREYGYELDALDHLTSFVNDADRKTEMAKKRLLETQEELSSEVSQKLDRVHELAEEIGKKLAAAEKLGADGNVEESIKMMEEVENVKKEKAAAEVEYRNSMPASSYQQQKLRVCEVCSAYLGIHDNDRRLADHFGGKLHLGFISIREKLEDLKAVVEEKKAKGLFDRIERGGRGDNSRRQQDNRDGDRNFDRRRGGDLRGEGRGGNRDGRGDRGRGGGGGYDRRHEGNGGRWDDRNDRRRRSRSPVDHRRSQDNNNRQSNSRRNRSPSRSPPPASRFSKGSSRRSDSRSPDRDASRRDRRKEPEGRTRIWDD